MPLLMLRDPGFWASVGVSNPAGASVADCCAMPASPSASEPSSMRTTAMLLRIMMSPSWKMDPPETGPGRQQEVHPLANCKTGHVAVLFPAGVLRSESNLRRSGRMSGTPPLSQSASVRALTGCCRRCHRDPADHRGVDRAVVAKVAQADCHWLAQRARCEGTCINGAVVEHDVM